MIEWTAQDQEKYACNFALCSRGLSYLVQDDTSDTAIPVFVIKSSVGEGLEASLSLHGANKWAKAQGFKGKVSGEVLYVPSASDGASDKVLVIIDRDGIEWPGWQFASLSRLPSGTYKLAEEDPALSDDVALGFLLGTYSFDQYKTKREGKGEIRLVWPSSCDQARVKALAEAIFLARDLITTPGTC